MQPDPLTQVPPMYLTIGSPASIPRHSEINEGMIRFDIIFYVRMKDGLAQVIINIEIQKDEPTQYFLLNRAIFYVSRMVSSQKGRDFVHQNYNDMKRVFSIWLCMNMPIANSMSYVHLTKEDISSNHYNWNGHLDLLNIVLLGIGRRTAASGRAVPVTSLDRCTLLSAAN